MLPVSRRTRRSASTFAVAGLRPGRAAADAGLRAVRSRHRHERLDVPATSSGTTATVPIAARCSSTEELAQAREVLPLLRPATATASPYRTLPGVHPKGAYFTRGSGHNQYGAYTEDSRRIPGGARPAAREVARRPRSCVPRAGHRCDRAAATIGIVIARQLRRRGARGDRRARRAQGVGARLHARARASRSARTSSSSSHAHEVDVRRRAEPRRAAALAADARDRGARSRKLRSILHYSGLPISAEFIVEGVLAELQPRGKSQSGAAAGEEADMTFHCQAEGRAPVAAEERARPHAARLRGRACRRCAPAAATTRSPPRSSRPAGSSTSSRRTWSKLSGIGCSSKTTAYFVSGAHGFNSVHGRMPSIATGANAANRELHLHRRLRRRRLALDRPRPVLPCDPPQPQHAVHHREQRRVRPHQGPVLRLGRRRHQGEEGRGEPAAADRSGAAGADARRLLRGAQLLRRQGAARAADPGRRCSTAASRSSTCSRPASPSTITRARPRATPTRASTTSRRCTRTSCRRQREIAADYAEGETLPVVMHDGSRIVLRKLDGGYDPTDRSAAAGAHPGAHEGRANT